jgi:hypothetical protein
VAVNSFVVAEKLGQILRTSIRYGPLEFGWVPGWGFGFVTLWLRNSLSLFFSVLVNNSLFLFNYFWLCEFFPLFVGECGGLGLILEANYSSDLSNVFLNLEHFVHVSKRKLVIFILELSVVA